MYVLWDWNGTLLDDVAAGCNAVLAMLERRGLPGFDLARYRMIFGFPVRNFYTAAGFRLDEEDWDALAGEFHRLFRSDPSMKLRPDAMAAIGRLREAGVGQSVISALKEELLLVDTAAAGVTPFMDAIRGTDNIDGASKLDRARALAAELGLDPRETTLIGDTLHDLETAEALGTDCVLVDIGHQNLAARAPAGVRIVPSLGAAVDFVLETRTDLRTGSGF